MKHLTNVDLILVIDDGVAFFYILADLLSGCSINCWYVGIDVPNYNCIFACFSSQFDRYCFIYFVALLFDTPKLG